ncbi:MAG: hypothetical protein VB106_02565 [Clostridiaceae bacterium]|nr:hypothetical protein [Clostridiaceae bacterium]
MNKNYARNIVAILLCIATVFSSFTTVYAGTAPSRYDKDEYKTNGTVDYEKIHSKIFSHNGATAPTAKFEIHVERGDDTYVYHSDADKKIEVSIGDILTIVNTSELGSGNGFSKCDFQVSDGTTIKQTTSLDAIVSTFNDKIDTSDVGTYHVYLNIMDNEDENNHLESTEGWGNWAYNGSYSVVGQNPVGGTASSFDCWWYYSNMTIKVKPHPPNADFTIEYQDDDVTDNKTSPATIDPEDMSLVLEDCSTSFSAAEPITSRKWSYWDVNSGWKEIPGSTNKTAVNISNMDSSLPGSGTNKAFKLDVTSSSGGIDDESHTAYFKKVLTSGYIVYYRDQDTGRDIYPAKVMEGLGFGTYTETARTAPENGELVTPSPTTIVLDAAHPFVEFVFYYKFTTPPPEPSTDPPTAILKLPKEVMAGAPVKADGSDSWSNNPGGYIADYYFEYEGANLIKDNGSDVRIWYPAIGTYEVYLEVEDENGDTDWDEQEIEVKLPIPTAVITVTGILKENRKVTISSINSTSPQYYPIDVTKIVWTITPVSGGTEADIKYTGTLNGNVSKDLLFKKAGTYRIRLTVYNTYGRSASAEQTITIVPDLPPVAKITLPTPAGVPYKTYRDPGNSNYATAQIFNESYSPDGDTINKAVVLYCYDSDNDGDCKDEQWYYSKDGDTWISTGMTYANTVSFFNIYNISTSNVSQFTLKSKEVGRYHFAIRVMETILASETIPEFITESDYKRDDDF